MNIYNIQGSGVDAVAELMSSSKPEWWDYEGAKEQLQDVNLLAKLVGWYLGDDELHPWGWILCAEFAGYSYLSIECPGFNDNGKFMMEAQLERLLVCAEEYAKTKGFRNLKYIIGSTEMSCHGKPITDYSSELSKLTSYNREHFDYFEKIGFVPTGFIPNCYGLNYHGIIMIKSLV